MHQLLFWVVVSDMFQSCYIRIWKAMMSSESPRVCSAALDPTGEGWSGRRFVGFSSGQAPHQHEECCQETTKIPHIFIYFHIIFYRLWMALVGFFLFLETQSNRGGEGKGWILLFRRGKALHFIDSSTVNLARVAPQFGAFWDKKRSPKMLQSF